MQENAQGAGFLRALAAGDPRLLAGRRERAAERPGEPAPADSGKQGRVTGSPWCPNRGKASP